MKLFQQLLVAPAALGLIAPMAATAADLNINDVSSYSTNGAASQSISDFSDVYPTDWAYQALNDLRQRSGCTAAIPSGSMTRYEAASLLNKCLNNIAQVNEAEQSLIDEFSAELAVIQGRLDVLENDLDGIEAGVFSSTTKLSGSTTFVMGGVDGGKKDSQQTSNNAVTFAYKTDIYLDSSFTGEDLLRTRIRTGNFTADQPFTASGNETVNAALETASTGNGGTANSLGVDRAYYQFPLRKDWLDGSWDATIGALVRQDDMLGVWPSAYPSDSVLDVLTYAGGNATYSLPSGAGAGLTYTRDKLVASALFVSEEANSAANATNAGGGGGLLTAQGSDDITAQIAWVDDRFTLAAAHTWADNGNTTSTADINAYTAWAISGVYNLDSDISWLPASISYGMGWSEPEIEGTYLIDDQTTWTLGVLWEDAFVEGNTLGFGVGSADGDTSTDGIQGHRDCAGDGRGCDGYDDPLAYEVFYQMAVSDNITVTPAIFAVQADGTDNDDTYGALVKTTFSF